jgi:predicted ATPase
MGGLPAGTVTFVFTDVEGSTRLLDELGAERYADALAEHRRALRKAFARHGGVEVDTQGDAFFFAFRDGDAALTAAAEGQAAFSEGPIRVRMGIHTGTPVVTDEGYVGADVHQAARIAAAAHGGQVAVSATTRSALGDGAQLVDLGEHRLKDIDRPVWIYQLGDGRFPPLKTISNTNLPRPASSFVGREEEVARVVAALRNGARLLTLTGPGGSGKTRLAIEAAAELVPEFPNGVFWVALASLRSASLVEDAIAQAIGVPRDLGTHLVDRELLLLLDNFEQVVDAAPKLAGLLEACPRLHLLITSRILLRVRGEVEYEVPPLVDREAVELFTARSGLPPGPDVEELCRRLDNLPLAVELAAARAKVLTPAQIVTRLSERLDLLKGGRDAEPRQQTLRATIAWSHDLCAPEEQQLFQRLAVFTGGCTAAAAEAVCDADLDTLQSLVEQSLLRRTDERFWMLETIREYASELLDRSGAAEGVRRRHAEYFLDLALSANLYVEADGPQRHDVVLGEQDNLRTAIDWAHSAGETTLALELAVALENFWVASQPEEGSRRLEELLNRAVVSDRLRARALRVWGTAIATAGEFERGREVLEEGRALAETLGDESGRAHLEARLSSVALNLGDLDEAERLIRSVLAFFRGTRFRKGEVPQIGQLGMIACLRGDAERGLELILESAAGAAEIGFVFMQAGMLSTAAGIALETGRPEDAERWAREAIPLLARIGAREGVVWALILLARLASERDEPERAGLLWGAAEAEETRAPLGGEAARVREASADAVLAAAGDEFEQARSRGFRLTLDEAVGAAAGDT